MKSFNKLWALLLIIPIFLSLALTKAGAVSDGKEKPATELSTLSFSPGNEDRRTGIHDGNLIRSAFSNFGNLGSRTIDIRGEWPKSSGINYLFECSFYTGVEVVDSNGNVIHIISDSYTGGPRDMPESNSYNYAWQPLPGFYNPELENINDYPAMSHLPETWPDTWPNKSSEWDGQWNGEFGPYPIADQESYYVIDDRDNDEFAYYPFIGSHQDSLPYPDGRRGLGIEVAVRGCQWTDPRLEDTWFAIYDITNVSHKDLAKVVCGFYHDFDVGTEGSHSDAGDDSSAINMETGLIYQWDMNRHSATGKPTHYVGTIILQAPDDLGLTSFFGTAAGDVLSDDEEAWNNKALPGIVTAPSGSLDVAFITGSGYFSIMQGETKRYAIAVVLGDDLEELSGNAKFAKWFYDGNYTFDIHSAELIYPSGSETVDGIVDIQWAATGPGDPLQVDIFYSIDDWKIWHVIAENEDNDGSFSWDTNSVVDGINYSVMVVAHSRAGMGQSLYSDHFTINNPVSAQPEVFIVSPVSNETVSGVHNITWRAGDADGDVVHLDLFYSTNDGQTWNLISANEANDGIYQWNTTPLPNGVNYTLKAIVTDGTLEGMDVLEETFRIDNYHPILMPATVEHVSGVGDGDVSVNVIDIAALTGHTYELTFSVSDSPKIYNVYDLDEGKLALQDVVIDATIEGPAFDGVRLWVNEFSEAMPIDSLSRWTTGEANLQVRVAKDPGKNFVALPADFEIRVLGTNADTTYSAIPSYRIPVNFQVWNVTDSVKMEFVFKEFGEPDSVISANDIITIITDRVGRRYYTSWRITFEEPRFEDGVLPDSSDVAFIAIAKPFSEKDIFRFKTLKDYIVSVASTSQGPQTFSLAQNYPNPFNMSTIIEYNLPKAFHVTLKVYDILGREVVMLVEERQKEGFHRVFWDGCGYSSQLLASGIYFYHIRAGDYVKIKKAILLR